MSEKIWGDYEVYLDKPLGKGGMGAVYRGRQVSVDRPVAIKILKRDLTSSPDFVGRFNREATLLAKLVDTHIVQIFGAGEAEGQHFYAMEFVEGEDLSSRLRRGHQFSPDEILHISIGTGKALDAAWKQKIIHRDIKPSNIIVAESDQVVKVMDFGLAKNPENDLTQTEMIMGTAKYMSPEQATGGACDIRSDLYALGAVMYELGTGTAPFVGESATAVIYQHVHKEPVPPQKLNPSLPQSIQGVILRLLTKSPDDRYQTPAELVKDCQAILEGVTPDEKTILYGEVGKVAPSTVEKAGKTMVTSPDGGGGGSKGKILGIILVLLLLGGAGVFFGSGIFPGGDTNGEEDPFQVALSEAKKASAGGEWERAIQKYTEALRHLPEGDERRKEVKDLRVTAGYQSMMSAAERAKGSGDLKVAMEKYAAARGWLSEGDPRISKLERLILDTRISLVERYVIKRNWGLVIQECDELLTSLSAEDKRRGKVSDFRNRARGERALAKAEASFDDQKWPVAIAEYEGARKLLPREHPEWKSLAGKISVAQYQMYTAAANRETDLDQRIILLEQAATVENLSEERRKIAEKALRGARVTRALERAQGLEKLEDWSGAGKALLDAARYKDDASKAKEYREKGEFYTDLGKLEQLKAIGKWREALKKVKGMLENPPHFGKLNLLIDHRKAIEEAVALALEKELERLLAEFNVLIEAAIEAYQRGAWAVAAEKIGEAGAAVYAPFQGKKYRDWVKMINRAGSPPDGMVYVPSRKYQIGKDGAGVAAPAHWVDIREFYIDEKEVSVASYQKFLAGVKVLGAAWKCDPNCSCKNGPGKHIPYKWDDQLKKPDSSVKGVNWWDAAAYMIWRSKAIGKTVRLPTEYELETAASWDLEKNQKRNYPWGNLFGEGTGRSFMHLSGLDNKILEWTSSPWEPYPGHPGNFPREGKGDHVLRGGYKLNEKAELQTWHRWGERPGKQGRNYGFRCVRSIE